MTMIRHANLNIVVMTQDPTFVHSALRKLVDVHYHISHPFKDGKPKVFQFAGAMSTIDDKGAWKTHAVESFTHKLDKETTQLYKSVEDGAKHDQKRKIPKRVVYMIAFVIAIILIGIPVGIWGIGKVYAFINGADERSESMLNNTKDNAETITSGGSNAASGFGQTPEELTKEQLDELYKKYLDDYTVEVGQHDLVRPDSIMSMNGTCRAYNMYGDGLNITQEKCFDMLANPETRPHKRSNTSMAANNNANNPNTNSTNATNENRDYINNPPPPIQNNS